MRRKRMMPQSAGAAGENTLSEYLVVRGSGMRLGDPKQIQASVAKRRYCRTRKVLVGEEFHAVSRSLLKNAKRRGQTALSTTAFNGG
jgi:hypothetical protein